MTFEWEEIFLLSGKVYYISGEGDYFMILNGTYMKAFCLVFIFLVSFDLFAKDEESTAKIDSASINKAYNILYLDAGALIFPPSLDAFYSINYERVISDIFNIRAGYGLSASSGMSSHPNSTDYEGFLLMLNASPIKYRNVNLAKAECRLHSFFHELLHVAIARSY